MIEAHDIHKSYGALEVLKGVSLRVARGEVVSITGPSGAGKTTLLQIIGTLSTPDSGTVAIDGEEVTRLGDARLSDFRNRKIGFVFQFHRLLPEFTALENVMLPALIARRGRAEAEREASELLRMMNLAQRADHKPAALSRRTAPWHSARARQRRPAAGRRAVGNLDSKNREEIHALFFRLRDELGQTTVIVTHDEELASTADRKIAMRDGIIE